MSYTRDDAGNVIYHNDPAYYATEEAPISTTGGGNELIPTPEIPTTTPPITPITNKVYDSPLYRDTPANGQSFVFNLNNESNIGQTAGQSATAGSVLDNQQTSQIDSGGSANMLYAILAAAVVLIVVLVRK